MRSCRSQDPLTYLHNMLHILHNNNKTNTIEFSKATKLINLL
jgi:hypothetical protein